MTKYRTIVADPPWTYGDFNSYSTIGAPPKRASQWNAGGTRRPLPYSSLTVEAITALPVQSLAQEDAHLYLWTTQRYVWDAPEVVKAWGFRPACLLVWTKAPRGTGLGGAFAPTTEFVLFARRGRLRELKRHDSTWFHAKRPQRDPREGQIHSAKPEAFLDIVESVSPGPYLELFARRQRLGWDTWGNQALEHVEMSA